MKRGIFLFFVFANIITFAQISNNRILYIIDSIPVWNDPEPWNQIFPSDIADYSVITNRDSLRMLGWEQMDGVTYIFTKEYRSRPDSIKRIPCLKKMVMQHGMWMLYDQPYSGPYIDYYNNGKIQDEGHMLNGKLNGGLTVYDNTGSRISVSNWRQGIRHGRWTNYYQDGAVKRITEFVEGKQKGHEISYFINGQIEHEFKPKRATRYDTSISYYSTGKVKATAVTKTGEFPVSKAQSKLNSHTASFYQNLRTGNMNAANRDFFQIWLLDSASADTHFKEGLLLSHEFRFDEAIAQFDNALSIEPLMTEALEQRGLARIRKYKYKDRGTAFQKKIDLRLTLEDFVRLPSEEQAKVCGDFLLADELNARVNNISTGPTSVFANFCKKNTRQ